MGLSTNSSNAVRRKSSAALYRCSKTKTKNTTTGSLRISDPKPHHVPETVTREQRPPRINRISGLFMGALVIASRREVA